MERNQYFSKYIIVFLYFTLVFCIAIYNYIKPYYSYDLVPYIAATIALEENNPERVHEDTYSTLKKSVPKTVFNEFTSGKFGEKMYTDFISFNQQLNYYTVKPFYIFLIYILHKLGFGIVSSVHVISALSFVGISILLFLFLNKLNSGYLGLIILSLLMICQPFVLLAGRNTPDTLSAFIILLALYIMLNSKAKYLACILLVLSIAVRPDNLIILGAFMCYFGLISPKQYRLKLSHMVFFILLSLITFFTISSLEGSYGWKMQFTISFLHTVYRPADTIVHLSMNDYFKVLILNGLSILNTHIIYFIVFGLIGIGVTKFNKENLVLNHLILITIGIMIFYFLLFPSKEVDRYFNTEYLMLSIFTIQVLCNNHRLKENVFKESLKRNGFQMNVQSRKS